MRSARRARPEADGAGPCVRPREYDEPLYSCIAVISDRRKEERQWTSQRRPSSSVIERSCELPVVVDFWAAWCGPGRTLGPAIEREVEKRTGKLELAKIDIDAEQALAARFGIQSIPTVAVFRDGEPVTGFVGAYPPATIGKFLDELLAKEVEAAAA